MSQKFIRILLFIAFIAVAAVPFAQVAAIPSESGSYLDIRDKKAFLSPSTIYQPETWFHFIGGNISRKGITADLEAIAQAGISGVQLFHGQFGGRWPATDSQIYCLSPAWDAALHHTALECRRLGLRFTMQNCPGWAMAGGPWIQPSNAMRHLVWSRRDISAEQQTVTVTLTKPGGNEPWRDYKAITVLAFPTPEGDTDRPLVPAAVTGSPEVQWNTILSEKPDRPVALSPAAPSAPHWFEVTFDTSTIVRSIVLPSINSLNHSWCYEPGVALKVVAVSGDGGQTEILNTRLPQSNWQDNAPLTLACAETPGVKRYRVELVNEHDIRLGTIRLLSAARKNNWESEAGWTLRTIERKGDGYTRPPGTCVDPDRIRDLTRLMDDKGLLTWKAPPGKWTILRIGHVNTGKQNGPAPPEGTGWECNKLSEEGAAAHFQGYIGRLSNSSGPVGNGLLNGMLLDSWECETQTWTDDMEAEFERVTAYPLRKWLPAVFGYVIKDPETTFRFLRDWRATISDLVTNKFYGKMHQLAKERNLSITYETAAGDVFPADIMEYYKYADVPMCEFWQPFTNGYVGSLNFKPIKPTTSAARLYGKPRIAAEAFTSFALTWDEQWQQLKEVANINMIEGVTHLVFHTYTHNPQTDFLKPGTSFGSGIGTPFLRGQTWWKHMPEINRYFARCNYLLEKGRPVSDILWYLGDAIDHKPDQQAPFPEGFKYDYCNTDVLLNRLSVDNGWIVTPEGIRYRLLWLPDNTRLLPETVKKIAALVKAGATVVGNAPSGIATLRGGIAAKESFDAMVKSIWVQPRGIRQSGRGTIISGMSLSDALSALNIAPDVSGGAAQWLHRSTPDADWYFICPSKGNRFNGTLSFRNTGMVELWDPVSGDITPIRTEQQGDRTSVALDLPEAGSCFLVFRRNNREKKNKQPATVTTVASTALTNPWTLRFPEGWGAPSLLKLSGLKPWKELDLSKEGKAFSGTAVYTTTFRLDQVAPDMQYSIDLGEVGMIASVAVNGQSLRTLWAAPYKLDITKAIRPGDNTLKIEVTSTWFNRLVYDAGLPEDRRKTWTINGPPKEAALRKSGLTGPVRIITEKTGR
ncbi:glycosyl hydrolase [Niabella beijingensis]|uniref:glycosyl hydrolase n=1 Tax=Niabella beijingensis TaxID=2872700 RepID=UPI001CBDBF71|nr:glycosyl hydrolase [Niabella beijingensis]MBZ4191957.1 hypothetical protein [Niabella beijingensis]